MKVEILCLIALIIASQFLSIDEILILTLFYAIVLSTVPRISIVTRNREIIIKTYTTFTILGIQVGNLVYVPEEEIGVSTGMSVITLQEDLIRVRRGESVRVFPCSVYTVSNSSPCILYVRY